MYKKTKEVTLFVHIFFPQKVEFTKIVLFHKVRKAEKVAQIVYRV